MNCDKYILIIFFTFSGFLQLQAQSQGEPDSRVAKIFRELNGKYGSEGKFKMNIDYVFSEAGKTEKSTYRGFFIQEPGFLYYTGNNSEILLKGNDYLAVDHDVKQIHFIRNGEFTTGDLPGFVNIDSILSIIDKIGEAKIISLNGGLEALKLILNIAPYRSITFTYVKESYLLKKISFELFSGDELQDEDSSMDMVIKDLRFDFESEKNKYNFNNYLELNNKNLKVNNKYQNYQLYTTDF